MRLNRKIVNVKSLKESKNEELSSLSPEALLLEVWEMTKEVYSLSKYDVESGLQRDVARLIRGKG